MNYNRKLFRNTTQISRFGAEILLTTWKAIELSVQNSKFNKTFKTIVKSTEINATYSLWITHMGRWQNNGC